jgi:hypothetical protein
MKTTKLVALPLLAGVLALTGGALAQASEMFLPVPEAAAGPAIDQDKGFLVEELGRGLYHLNDGAYTFSHCWKISEHQRID